MPIHLPALNRRQFLSGTLAAGVSLLSPRWLRAEPADASRFLLMADTHVGSSRDMEYRGIQPAIALEQVAREALALNTRLDAVIVAGDCAFREGVPRDYSVLGSLVRPLREAGLPIHLTLGNHDHRENFLAAFPSAKTTASDDVPPNKLVSVVESPHANWFLLDSLDKTNVTPGMLGKSQLTWLAKALDARPDRPALVVAHHNPAQKNPLDALADTEALFDVLLPRKHVKAYLFGHTHRWGVGAHKGLHLVNLPAVAWVFDSTQPRGFVTAQPHAAGATFKLRALNRSHAKHGETIDLTWRAA